jgi:hypothetical protein
MIVDWNKTQQTQTFADQKRIYCEFKFYSGIKLIGRPFIGVFDGKGA